MKDKKEEMKPRHTAGPWRTDASASGLVIRAGENYSLCGRIADVWSSKATIHEDMANALLISKAPEMFDAIESAISEADYALRYKNGESAKDLAAALLRIKTLLQDSSNDAVGIKGILWCDNDFAKSLKVTGGL